MKLAFGILEVASLLICSLARTGYATKRSAGNAFLPQLGNRHELSEPSAQGDGVFANSGTVDLTDDDLTPEELLSLSQAQPLRDPQGRDQHNVSSGLPHLALPAAGVRHNSTQLKIKSPKWITVRPGAEDNKVDVVTFGVYVKQFFGADLKDRRFQIDNVMTLSWEDKRASDLVPMGLDKLTMSQRDAADKIWMPQVVVTNKEIRATELISSGVTIHKSGKVVKVERALIKCKCDFELLDFPFDTQNMEVKIASAKYMAKEVKLQPSDDSSLSGAPDDVFDYKGWITKNINAYEYEETSGGMVKSRGVLRMTVERNIRQYKENHMMPAFIYLGISWGVFWFPFIVQFITPRLALSILALLTLTNLSIATSAQLPLSAPFNWNDLFNQTLQSMMFLTIVFNIYTEMCFHQLKCESTARSMNAECKFFIPCLSVISISIVLIAAVTHSLDIMVTLYIVRILDFILVGAYFLMCWARIKAAAIEHMKVVTQNIIDTHNGVHMEEKS